jgi:hypothetical protein
MFLRICRTFCVAASLLMTTRSFCQQRYVTRYDAFIGYAYLNSPAVNLAENGVHFQAGVRPKTWYSLGFDYSYSTGDLVITPDLLTAPLQQQLAKQLAELAAAGRLPPGYMLTVPAHSTTHSFAAGPQLSYRRFSHVTLFVRPSIGVVHETATPKPADPIATAVVNQLAPSGKKQDWTAFYGAGGGVDLNPSPHFGLRIQVDVAYDHLFDDLLANGRWTVRFSVGPAFNFGRNVAK